LLETSNEQW
jgi:hypothetical protein